MKQNKPKTNFSCFLIIMILLVLLYVGCLVFALHQYFFISKAIKQNPNDPHNNQQLLLNLEKLTNSWYSHLVKGYFFEEKIFQLAKAEKWDIVIEESKKALDYEQLKFKFSIWYHKAMAQCMTQRFSSCRDSYRIASSLNNETGQEYLRSIHQILLSHGMVEDSSPSITPEREYELEI